MRICRGRMTLHLSLGIRDDLDVKLVSPAPVCVHHTFAAELAEDDPASYPAAS